MPFIKRSDLCYVFYILLVVTLKTNLLEAETLDYSASFTLRDINRDGTVDMIDATSPDGFWGLITNAPGSGNEWPNGWKDEFFTEFKVSKQEIVSKAFYDFNMFNGSGDGNQFPSHVNFKIASYLGTGIANPSVYGTGTYLTNCTSPSGWSSFNIDVTDVYNNIVTSNNEYLGFRFYDPKDSQLNWEGGQVEIRQGSLIVNPLIPPQAASPQNLQQPLCVGDYYSQIVNLSDHPISQDNSTIVITHGLKGNTKDWIEPMANAIKNELGDEVNNYNILAWDWHKEASWIVKPDLKVNFWGPPLQIGVNTVLATARDQGDDLADFLYDNNLTKGLHLIGHSAGGSLIDEVAKELYAKGVTAENGAVVEQLTYLDTPDPSVTGYLAEWADNYISSALGSPNINMAGAYDYILDSPILDHSFAHEFYDSTIGKDEGFYWSKAGGGWDYKPDVNQSGGQGNPLDYETTPMLLTPLNVETFDNVGLWQASGDVRFYDGMATLKEHSPAYLFEEITFPIGFHLFSFDFKFDDLGDGDYLTANFNDDLLFWFEGTHFYGDDFWNSGPIDISKYSGQQGILTFALNSVGNPNSQIYIDNLNFYKAVNPVPEPSTYWLLGTGISIILLRKRKTT